MDDLIVFNNKKFGDYVKEIYKQRNENMSISNIISKQILFSKKSGKAIN